MAKHGEARRYREVGKPLAMQVVELIRALQIVNDSLSGLRRGRVQYLIPLSGQLRALLTDKSKGTEPLLLRLAKRFQKPLVLYGMPGIDKADFPNELRGRTVMHMASFPLSPHKQFPGQSQVAVGDFLVQKILLYKGNTYTATDLIGWFANRAGGAHYSHRMPEDFAALLTLDLMGMQPIANAVLQIGEVVLFCGRSLLKTLVDFEIHALLAIPAQSAPNQTYLFDARYEGSNMRLTVFVNNLLVPGFSVSGLQGSTLTVQADRLVDWSAPRHLHATLTIADDLATIIELAIDGDRVGIARIEEPLFLLSDPLDYDTYHHRSVEGPAQQTTVGVAEVIMLGREASLALRANLYAYFEGRRKQPDLPVVAYAPGSYGYAKKGTKDLTTEGKVTPRRVDEYLAGGVGSARSE